MYIGISTYFDSYLYISPHKNNNEEHLTPLPVATANKKLLAIDMLNISWSLVEAEISNSYCGGNGRHGCVAGVPHLFDLYGN